MTTTSTRSPRAPRAAATDSGRRYRGVSEEVRRAERRQRFIDAGLDVFGVRGYHNATVRSICASAGLTERYFYESFENSEDLLCSVYEFCVQRLRERVLSSLLVGAGGDVETMALTALKAFFAAMREDPRIARILFIEVLGISERVDMLYRVTIENFAALLIQVAHPLALQQLPSPLQPDLLANALIGSIIATASRWVLTDFEADLDGMTTNVHAVFVGTLRYLSSVAVAPDACA